MRNNFNRDKPCALLPACDVRGVAVLVLAVLSVSTVLMLIEHTTGGLCLTKSLENLKQFTKKGAYEE